MRKIVIAVSLLVGASVLAPSGVALAHNGAVAADCNNAYYSWTSFPNQTNHPFYSAKVDDLAPQTGQASFNGPSGSLTVPLLGNRIGGTHTVVVETHWSEDSGGSVSKTITVDCGRPPAPPTPPVAQPPVVDTPVVPVDTPVVATPVVHKVVKPKRCRAGYGRVHTKNGKGRRITLCRTHPKRKPVIHYRNPKNFTG